MSKRLVVFEFKGQYRYLSNFFIEPDGTNVESEFQAAKCEDPAMAKLILRMNPLEAKYAGRQCKMREDWDAKKLLIMYELVLKKFKDHNQLAWKLRASKPAILEEGNGHGDRFWGMVDGEGDNHLGKILMEVREAI